MNEAMTRTHAIAYYDRRLAWVQQLDEHDVLPEYVWRLLECATMGNHRRDGNYQRDIFRVLASLFGRAQDAELQDPV